MAKYKFYSVTSLSHSGSTVFSMALACHQNLVSLGEVFQVVRYAPAYWLANHDHKCSCGEPAANCQFWGPALQKIQRTVTMPKEREDKYGHIAQAYKVILDHFHEQYGFHRFMVDTSKGTRHLKLICNEPDLDPTVYFLIRDVRAYATSQTRLANNEQRRGLKRVKGHYWFQMLKWYAGNRKREQLLMQHRVKFSKIGYEHFCFHVSTVLNNLYHQAGLTNKQCDSRLDNAEHHILFGNPMRLTTAHSADIRYDSRWFQEAGYTLPACLLPFVMKYNNANVYQ